MLEVFLLFANAHTEKKHGVYITLHLCHFLVCKIVTLLTGLQGDLAKKFYEFILFKFYQQHTCSPKSYASRTFCVPF
jgi:hypothetical protein